MKGFTFIVISPWVMEQSLEDDVDAIRIEFGLRDDPMKYGLNASIPMEFREEESKVAMIEKNEEIEKNKVTTRWIEKKSQKKKNQIRDSQRF